MLELIDDLRLLSILNALHLTREQSQKLAGVAGTASETLASIDRAATAKIDQQHDRLLVAREAASRGRSASDSTNTLLTSALDAGETLTTQRTEALIANLTARVRLILSRDQTAVIEDQLAPSRNQPWRSYQQSLGAPGLGKRYGGQMPSDPGKWLGELRDLRIDSAEGDPNHEIRDFGRKMTRTLRGGTPLFDQSDAQARAFAGQVLGMPQAEFDRREWELAKLVAKQELDTRNQQNRLDGKPIEVFDPYRWFVEQVLLSPRAAVVLTDRSRVP